MKRTPRKSTLFTPEQDALLREHYIERGQVWCARNVGRTVEQVRSRAFKLHLRRARAHKPDPVSVRYDDSSVALLLTGWQPAPGALDREEAAA